MYSTVALLREYLDQVEVTTATTTALTNILARASATVRSYLRALLAAPMFDFAVYGAASTKIVTAYGGNTLIIPAHQSASVTLVEYEATTNPTTWSTIADEWYELDGGPLYRAYSWGWNYSPATMRYRVTAVWGYGDVPAEIEQITLELAVNIWRSKDKGGFTEVIGAEGGGAIRAISGLPKHQREALEAWANTVREVAV